jgi:hypothetical protein
MHVGGRRRGKGPRLLYWFRTPPGIRVGRAPIDEAAIRLLEQHNPDVQFDWTRILKDPPVTDTPVRRDGREGRDRRERDRPPRSGSASQQTRSAQSPAPPKVQPPVAAVGPVELVELVERAEVLDPVEPLESFEPLEPLERLESVEAVEPAELPESGEPFEAEPRELVEPGPRGPFEPEPLERLEPVEPLEPFEPTEADRSSASFARLGAEGLVRLRARYAEVMARIAERPLDDEAREELKQRAERLNPDAWVTADEVSAALEQYETVFEGLRAVVGRHPRRRRRSRK